MTGRCRQSASLIKRRRPSGPPPRGSTGRDSRRVHNGRLQVQSVCVFWQTLNRNVDALQDRGHVLLFEPTAAEVHQKGGTWFDDPEIYEWFSANLHRVREPSQRHYSRAKELRSAGMDWTAVLAEEAENRRARLGAELLASTRYASTPARGPAVREQGGGCRATFFNYRRRLDGGSGNGNRVGSTTPLMVAPLR